MKRYLGSPILRGVLASSWILAAAAASALTPAELQGRVERLVPGGAGPDATSPALAQALKDFYAKRAFRPLWFVE